MAIPINGLPPNLFRGLLSYRPRPDRDSRENFLTESFAYAMAKDPKMAVRILRAFVDGHFSIKKLTGIRTQVSLDDAEGRGLPDMLFEIVDTEGNAAQVWIENKWDSAADVRQLQMYLRQLQAVEPDTRKHLVLLTPRYSDALVCPASSRTVKVSHMSWSKIHEVVKAHSAHEITQEFEQFLYEQQLVVRPITLAIAQEYQHKLRAKQDWSETRLLENLWTLCERVRQTLPPGEILNDPDLRTGVNYGRVGLWAYQHRVTLGILHNPTDHRTAFLDESRPLDLIVRIEGAYKKAEALAMRPKFAGLVQRLEQAGFACNQGRWHTGYHTLVLGHFRAGFPFDISADEQVARVSAVFSLALSILEEKSSMRLLRQVRKYY